MSNVLISLIAVSFLFNSWFIFRCGTDLLNPKNVYIGTWVIVWFCVLYNSIGWKYEIRFYTVFVFILASFSFLTGASIIQSNKSKNIYLFKKYTNARLLPFRINGISQRNKEENISSNPIKTRTLLICLFGLTLATYGAYLDFLAVSDMTSVLFFNNFDFEHIATWRRNYILNIEAGNHEVPFFIFFLRQFGIFNTISPVVYVVWSKQRKGISKYIYFFLIISCAFLYSTFYLQRKNFFDTMSFFLIAYLLYYQPGKKKIFLYLIVSVILIFMFSYWLTHLRSGSGKNFLEMTAYASGGVAGLDVFLNGTQGAQKPVSLGYDNSNITEHGPKIFTYGLNLLPAFLSRELVDFGLVHKEIIFGSFGEYIFEPQYTNIYTYMREFYQAFHLPGIVILSLLYGFVCGYLWSKVRDKSIGNIMLDGKSPEKASGRDVKLPLHDYQIISLILYTLFVNSVISSFISYQPELKRLVLTFFFSWLILKTQYLEKYTDNSHNVNKKQFFKDFSYEK